MKKALSLILALVMCLSLCACGGGNPSIPTNNEATQNTTSEDISNSEDIRPIIAYDYTSSHPLLNTVYGEWVLDGSLSWMVMPLKILFREDGT